MFRPYVFINVFVHKSKLKTGTERKAMHRAINGSRDNIDRKSERKRERERERGRWKLIY